MYTEVFHDDADSENKKQVLSDKAVNNCIRREEILPAGRIPRAIRRRLIRLLRIKKPLSAGEHRQGQEGVSVSAGIF